MRASCVAFLTVVALAATTNTGFGDIVFYTNFESSLPNEISATGATIQGTQGFGTITNPSNPTNVFQNNFFRYDSSGISPVTLTLTNLPNHNAVDIGMLLAVIDSWDNAESLQIRLDGQLLFSHRWILSSFGDSSTYLPPPGVLLSSGTNLGFSSGGDFNKDRAYDLSLDPLFQNIPHSGSSLLLEFLIDAKPGSAAENWQGGNDESWAIDNLSIEITSVPEPTSATAIFIMTFAVAFCRRR